MIDLSGTIISSNPAAESVFGYNASEMIGTDVKMLMPEPHQSAHDAYLERTRYFTGIIRDRTEKVEAENAVRESERRLSIVIEASGCGIFDRAVPAGEELYLSQRWYDILGYDRLPVSPHDYDAWFLAQIHPDDRARRQQVFEVGSRATKSSFKSATHREVGSGYANTYRPSSATGRGRCVASPE